MEQKDLDMLLDDGKRKFEIEFGKDDTRTFFLRQPQASDIKDAEWAATKAYNKALRDGLYTKSEMMDILRKRGIIGIDHDQVGATIQDNITAKVIEMERNLDKDLRLGLAVEVSTLRNSLMEWNQRLTVPMANTCEELAQTAKVEYLACVLTVDSNGKRVWEDYDKFKEDRNIILQTRARLEVMLWIEGLDSALFDNLPERVVLNKVIQDMVEDQAVADKALADEAAKVAAVGGDLIGASVEVSSEPSVVESQPAELVSKPKRGRRKNP